MEPSTAAAIKAQRGGSGGGLATTAAAAAPAASAAVAGGRSTKKQPHRHRTNADCHDPFDNPESIAARVEMLRYRASAHARARGGFFRKAAAAFERGNHGQAKQLSAAGHEQGARVDALNEEARDLLIASNSVGRNDREEIDLHGLHATEALNLVRAQLDAHREERAAWKGGGNPPTRKVNVITGKGLHSRAGPRLRPAVENLLQLEGIDFRVAHDGGSLKITLR